MTMKLAIIAAAVVVAVVLIAGLHHLTRYRLPWLIDIPLVPIVAGGLIYGAAALWHHP